MGFAAGDGFSIAIAIYNAMGGRLDYQALPVLVEYYGVTDVELLLDELLAIRDHQDRQANG